MKSRRAPFTVAPRSPAKPIPRRKPLVVACLLLSAGALVAGEFQSLFDGVSLLGWKAPNMSYWSVQDGAITAESTPANPCRENQFLLWQGGEVADFELKALFRLGDNRGNSGIQFRSQLTPTGDTIGYQADILPEGDWLGGLCDENTPRDTLLAPNGHKTVIAPDGKRTTTRLGDPVKLMPAGEWNEYHITARSNHMVLRVNGQTSAEVVDLETGRFHLQGILALQLRSGPPMKVQFKDIRLRRLGPARETGAAAPAPGSGGTTTESKPARPQPGAQADWRVFVGQWNIGAPTPPGGPPFVMSLREDFSARKSHVPNATGTWEYRAGEARITWSDGWRDLLRRAGETYRKFAFQPGTTFDSPPSNTASAEKQAAEPPSRNSLRIGWARTDITPNRPVGLVGFGTRRFSEGVKDPITATVLALERARPNGQSPEQAILVSCDLIEIRQSTMAAVRRLLKARLGDFDSDKLLLNATHTHQAPQQQSGTCQGTLAVTPEEQARGWMTGDDYGKLLAERIAEAAVKAWEHREPGGVSWALDQAVVGFNRRFIYRDGSARMFGEVNTPDFDGVEGVEDHGLLLLFFWNTNKALTGIVINVASPAQSEQGGNLISADFWHDVRTEIAARLTGAVFVFPQCGAAGDIFPQGKFRHRAEAAMAGRKGITWRQEIARRIADGVGRALPVASRHIEMAPVFKHAVARIDLPEKDPPAPPFALLDSVQPVELHLLRLGEIAVATSPFELFTDYGMRIQARSPALLTFVVQLACGHSEYLPTTRAVQGGGYSAEQYLVGPEGGRVLVEETIKRLEALWP